MSTGQQKRHRVTFTDKLKPNCSSMMITLLSCTRKNNIIRHLTSWWPNLKISAQFIKFLFTLFPYFIADLCQERCYSTRYWWNDALLIILDKNISYFAINYLFLFCGMLLLSRIMFLYEITGSIYFLSKCSFDNVSRHLKN